MLERDQASEVDGGLRSARKADAPQRLCALTRVQRDRDHLIRFVLSPDGIIVPDLALKLPGRGVWISADSAHVSKALKSGAFQRSLKKPAVVPDDLLQQIEQQLSRSVLQALALANKAAQVVCGFDKVHAVIERGAAIALFHGRDAAEDGRRKLDAKYRAISAAMSDCPATIVELFTIEQLSLALGRENVVHAALSSGGAAMNVLRGVNRMVRFEHGVEAEPRVERTPETAPP